MCLRSAAEALTFLRSVTGEAALRRMDCSEEVQCVSEEPGAQLELKKGMSIFIDVSTTISNFFSQPSTSSAHTQGSIINMKLNHPNFFFKNPPHPF